MQLSFHFSVFFFAHKIPLCKCTWTHVTFPPNCPVNVSSRYTVGSMNALTIKRHSRSLSHSLSLSLFLSSSPNTSEFTQNRVNKTSLFFKSQQRMVDSDLYLVYHGLLLPKVAHTEESLKYLQNFQVKDDDVFAVTYPKSGKIILCFQCILFISPHAFNKTDLLHYIFLILL